ncbi:MAG: multicopper oxidase family protein [Betaproteobacteria bacterium]|nr:multicopper oxidase family protein [Betaproteobacteria bacterium]PWB59180.1 MAG: copper oxidase [Betaproteobacteria bacterium]
MPLTRRDFLQSAGAALGALALPSASSPTPADARPPAAGSVCVSVPPRLAGASAIELVPGVCRQAIRPDGPQTEIWGFNGSAPGPLLRFRQGESVAIRVRNALPQPTTVHWHGLRVPNAMDGVPHVTQHPIALGGTFDYRYRVEDTGTYWYHPHQSSFEQVPRGLYGMLVVEEAKPLAVDREVHWVLSDFKLDQGNRPVEDFGRILDFGTEGRHGNVVTLNGTAAGAHRRLELRPGERVRLRLLNAASARAFLLEFRGHSPWIVAYDGQAVAPHPIPDGRLLLGAGQRTDLVLDGTRPGAGEFAVVDHRRAAATMATLAYAGKPARAKALGRPAALAPNRYVEPDLGRATDHYLVFEGSGQGTPAIGRVDGKALDVEDIARRHGLTWTMNYTAQHEHAMMHEPLFRLRRGEHATVKMINNTDFEHPMHLHGHFFRVLAINDIPTRLREWRDTVVIDPRGSCDIALVADNVGEWMFHCHILDHAAGGMMGTVVVEA